MSKASSIPVCVAILSMGCLGNPTVPFDNPDCGAPLGSFVGRAAGEAGDTLSGCAYFSIDTTSQRFAMVLTNGSPDSFNPMIRIFRSELPDTGLTFVGASPGQLSGMMQLGTRTFTLTSGSLRRRYSASESLSGKLHVSGTLDITGTDVFGAVLTVRGSFQGVCTTTGRADPGLNDDLNPRDRSCMQKAAAFISPRTG